MSDYEPKCKKTLPIIFDDRMPVNNLTPKLVGRVNDNTEDLKNLYEETETMQGDIENLQGDVDGKLDVPETAGTSGQVLTSDGEGGAVWASVGSGEIVVDPTLTVEGAAADAKKTGDEITHLKQDISETAEQLESVSNLNFLKYAATIAGYCSNTGSFNTDGTTYHRTDYIPVNANQVIRTGKIRFATFFNSSKQYNSGESIPSANTQNTIICPVDGYVIISVYNTSISDGTLWGTFGDSFNIFTEKALESIQSEIETVVDIKQTTGSSQTALMSQKAITDELGLRFGSLGLLSSGSIYSVSKNGTYIIIDENVSNKPETGVGILNVYKQNSSFTTLYYYAYPTRSLYICILNGGNVYSSWMRINPTITQETGASETALMSQKAVTDAINEATGGSTYVSPLVYNNKTIVIFGDSIIGNNDSETGVTAVMQNMIGGTIKNCAFGGTRFTVRSQTNGYEQFDFGNLVNCIVNNSYTALTTAISNYDLPSYYSSRVTRLAGIDFSEVDTVLLFYGTNDYTSGVIESTFKQSVIASISALQAAYKNLKVIVCSPAWRFWYTTEDGTGTYDYDSDTQNFGGGTLIQYCGYIKDISESEHCIFVDSYNIGINKNNYAYYFNDHDGTHHDTNGRALLGDYLARKLISCG